MSEISDKVVSVSKVVRLSNLGGRVTRNENMYLFA